MNLSDLDVLLKGDCPDTYRDAAPEGVSRYVVWWQDGAAALYGDDATVLALPRIWVGVYTQDYDDDLPERIVDALSGAGQPVRVSGPEYLDRELSIVTTLSLTLV